MEKETRTIILKHVRTESWGGVMGKYKSCFSYIAPYLTRTGNVYTGLTKEDETRLEKDLSYPEGTLAPTSKFWETFAIKLGDSEIVLRTSDPYDELRYLFLKSNKFVAKGTDDIKPGMKYVLIDLESEAKEKNILSRRRREAIVEFGKLSLEDMKKALRLYGFKSDNTTADVIEQKLGELVEKDPDKFFFKWINNSNREMEYIVEAAVSKNIIRKNRNIYMYGTETIGNSMEEVISHLNQENQNELKMAIIDEVNYK